jgi:hypothetical protein
LDRAFTRWLLVNKIGVVKTARCLFALLFFFSTAAAQQNKLITGKITDAQTGEPIPYATILVKLPGHALKGTSSDFDGLYHLAVPPNIITDSVYVTCIGYLPARKALPAASGSVDFQLTVSSHALNMVKITPRGYVNPASEIMANMVKHKPANDLKYLKSYQYQSYNRIELSIANLSEKLKKRKVFKQLLPIMDSLKKTAGDDGTPVLPVFMSETASDYYYENNPARKTEHVQRTRATGVGIEDETLVSQLVGTTFFQYDFYSNYLKLAGKDFMSPLTDSWKLFYNYELIDRNDKIDGKEYYKIAFKPKRSHDLAFDGVMWITKDSYALFRMNASVSADANLNFLKKVIIQQEMAQPDGTTAWIPQKTRIVVHISGLSQNSSGFIGKFYLSNNAFQVNRSYPEALFKHSLVLANDVNKTDDAYWLKNRQDSLTVDEKRMFRVIDTVKNLPLVKTYANLAGMLINGYYKVGEISLGPYPYTYSYNDLEGSVLRIGGITNIRFSDRWILGGFIAYGFRDHKLKYSATADYIFSRTPWIKGGVSYLYDIGQTGYQFENFINNAGNVFDASIHNGSVSLRGPFQEGVFKTYLQADLLPNVREKVSVTHRTFDPLFRFMYIDPQDKTVYTRYEATEIGTELQWTPGRRLLQSSKLNKQVSVGNGNDNPIITARYTHGIKAAGGDFNYNKFAVNIQQKPHLGIFGKGDYSLTAGYIPSALSLPSLENHRFNFNTMRFLEFTSDRYISLNYTQHMDGLITNSIPLLKALNIRTVADLNVLDGSLSNENNEAYIRGRTKLNRSLEGSPYVEIGYGVENILKIIRIDFLRRLTHTDHLSEAGLPPSNFAVRVTLQFRL